MAEDELSKRLREKAEDERKVQQIIAESRRSYDQQMELINPLWNELQDELKQRYGGMIYVDSGKAEWCKVEGASGNPIWGGEIVIASWTTRHRKQEFSLHMSFDHGSETTYSRTTYSSSNYGDTAEVYGFYTHKEFGLSKHGFHLMENRNPNPKRILQTYPTVAQFLPVYQKRIADAL